LALVWEGSAWPPTEVRYTRGGSAKIVQCPFAKELWIALAFSRKLDNLLSCGDLLRGLQRDASAWGRRCAVIGSSLNRGSPIENNFASVEHHANANADAVERLTVFGRRHQRVGCYA
jgi:hypothetical protein